MATPSLASSAAAAGAASARCGPCNRCPDDADCERYVLWVVEHLPVIIRRQIRNRAAINPARAPGHRAGQLPAADQSEDPDQPVQQMAGLVDADRRDPVQRRRHHVEHGAVIVEVLPVQRRLIAEKGQVIVEDEIAVPIVDILVPGDAVVAEGRPAQGATPTNTRPSDSRVPPCLCGGPPRPQRHRRDRLWRRAWQQD